MELFINLFIIFSFIFYKKTRVVAIFSLLISRHPINKFYFLNTNFIKLKLFIFILYF